MNIKKILTPKQLEVCQKEQYYYQQIGIKKHLLDIALSHHFIQKKETSKTYNLELMKEYEMVIVEERDDLLKIVRKELLGEKRLAELSQKVHKKVEQKNIPVREFQQKYTALLRVDPETIERKIKQFNAMDYEEDEVIDIFEMLLEYGIQRSASDIHINAYESFYWLRYRIDGKIFARYLLNHELAQRFALIIKERCNIDMINIYAPQGGSFTREFENRAIDFRIEISVWGKYRFTYFG
jgi:type II secretory ATPase GspE/PulE/Tfp pilus assembly ATPase PilB-like protein